MALVPGNPVVGGTVLRRAAIQSPNFVQSPLTGWSIDQDGNAFFASITLPSGATVQVYSQGTAPTGTIATGSLWFNTANGYQVSRWNGSAWVAITWTATDVIGSGTITAALIAANTITAAQIAAGTITATQIAANTITASQLAAGIVYAGIVDGTTITGSTLTIKNSHGAVIFTIDSSRDSWYLYKDTGSASQGALVASAAPANGTDSFGNTVKAGVVSYITVASGTGAGTYAIQLADQANPYAQFAALTFVNLSHAANLPPGVVGQVDATQGTELELQSGKILSTDSEAVIALHDSHATAAAIEMLADAVTVAPASVAAATDFQLTGFFVLGDQASTPSSVVGSGVLFVDSLGYLRFIPDNNSADSNVYQSGPVVFTAAGQTVNSLALANVTGIASIPVAANKKYRVRGMISLTQGGTTASQKIGITFPTASAMRIGVLAVESVAIEASATWTTAAASSTFSWPNGSTAEVFIDGIVEFSATGSLTLVVACVTSAADTFTVNSNSYLELQPA